MKKLITWLSKGTKIVKIITYIYTGLKVVKMAVQAGLDAFKEAKPDFDESKLKYLVQALEWIQTAVETIEMVLDWFGIDPKSVDVERADISTALDTEINKLKQLK